jgi:hypothetical protein
MIGQPTDRDGILRRCAHGWNFIRDPHQERRLDGLTSRNGDRDDPGADDSLHRLDQRGG